MISRRQLITGVGAGIVAPAIGMQSSVTAAPVLGSFNGFFRDIADNETSFFFSPKVGTEGPNRVLVAAIHSSGGKPGDLVSVMIGDVPAVVHVVLRSSGNDIVALASAPLPSGENVTINVKLAAPHNRCAVGVWSIYPTSNKPAIFSSEFKIQNAASVAPQIPAGALCICAFQGASTRVAWAGATSFYDETVETYLAASAAATGVPATIVATPSRAPNDCGMVAAVWD